MKGVKASGIGHEALAEGGFYAGPLGEPYTRRTRARLDWWGIGKGAALGALLGAAVVGVVVMPAVAAMVGVAVASVLTLGAMVVGGLCADVGRRMGVVSSGQ